MMSTVLRHGLSIPTEDVVGEYSSDRHHPNRTYRSALYVRYDGRDVASRQLVVPDLKHIRGDSDDPIGETNRDPRVIMPIFREQWTATACLIETGVKQ